MSSEDLLEPFPSENERRLCALFRRNPVSHIFPKRFSNCGASHAKSTNSGCINSNSSSTFCSNNSFANGFSNTNNSFSNDVSEGGGGLLDDSEGEMSESGSSSSRMISVANVVGDDEEFRQFQADLRKSRMVTGVGTQHVMRQYIEVRSRNVEARHQQDEELSKVKQMPERRIIRSFSDRVYDSFKTPTTTTTTTQSPPRPCQDESSVLRRGLVRRLSNSFTSLNRMSSEPQMTRRSSNGATRRGSKGFDLDSFKRNSFNLKQTDKLAMTFNQKGSCRSASFNNKRRAMIARGML